MGDAVETHRETREGRQSIRITADRELTLSRPAVEALLGIGFPNRRDDSADAMLDALRPHGRKAIETSTLGASIPPEEIPLPLEQTLRIETGGEVIETSSVVVRVGSELPPSEQLSIPPGARLVESREVAAHRLMQVLDGGTASSR